MRKRDGWLVLVLLVVEWSGMATGAEPDPEAVQRLMEKYEREAAEEAAKKAPAPKPQPKPAPTVNYDHEAWKSAERCGTAACFRAYLKKHPQGQYAEMARARLESAAPMPVPAPAIPVAAPAAPSRSSFEPDLVRIPAGCFQMGSPESETGRESDECQHRVCVEAFEIGQREVTVGEFKRFVAAMNYRTDAEKNAGGLEGCFVAYRDGDEWKFGYRAGSSWKNPNFQQSDDPPVVCVSWNDAVAYTQWLSRETGQTYRLPSEAEWEYAARAGTTAAWYWGDDPNRACRYANVADQTAKQTFWGWPIHDCTDGYVYTAPVGSFQPNAWKLYDMLGNVWEWTCSVYDKDYGGTELKCTNKGVTDLLAVRGGSWYSLPAWVRSADRGGDYPTYRYLNLGFRLARSL